MKFLQWILPVLTLSLTGCEEPFSPKIPFEPKPVVTCIVAPGYVLATVSTSYDFSGASPIGNGNDLFDINAVVIIFNGFRPDTLMLDRSNRDLVTGKPIQVYAYVDTNNIGSYMSSARPYTLTVITGSGKKVEATTTAPFYGTIESSQRFPFGVTPRTTTDPQWTFTWEDGKHTDHLFFPKLEFSYVVTNEDGSTISKKCEVPLRYVDQGGKMVPVYPSYTHDLAITYDLAALETVMGSISEGDAVKSHYNIGMLIFSVVEYDDPLSKFYATSHGYLDAYSIRVDETTYSNLTGAIGIFGSMNSSGSYFSFKTQFIQSFGYHFGLQFKVNEGAHRFPSSPAQRRTDVPG